MDSLGYCVRATDVALFLQINSNNHVMGMSPPSYVGPPPPVPACDDPLAHPPPGSAAPAPVYCVNLRFLLLISGDIECNPGPENDSLRKNCLNEDGICQACEKDAQNEYMNCFICKNNLHVIGCTEAALIQTSFHKNTWPGMHQNWPCLNFICPACMEDNKSKEDIAMSGRVRVLEESAASTSNKLGNIEQLLTELISNPEKKSYAAIAKPREQPSVIIIEKPTEPHNVEENNVRLAEITSAAIKEKAGIQRSFTNEDGRTVLVCNSEKSKKAMLPHVEKVFKERKINTPAPRLPTISVPFITRQYDNAELLRVLHQQNEDRGIPFTEDDAKVLFSAPMKDKDGYFQAVLRVSENTRSRVEANGNRLCIGLSSCPVYDRFFIKRCNRCQELGHFQKDNGGCKKPQVCALCTGGHRTEDCHTDEDQYKCNNCFKANRDEFTHAAYSPQCATYIAEQDKLKKSINYFSKNT